MNNTMRAATLLALGLSLQGCLRAQDRDVVAIHKVREELRRLTREGDVAGAMALFTDDALYLQPGEPADSGREAVRRDWQAGVDRMVVDIDYRADEVEVSGNLAFLRGSLTVRGAPRAGGDAITNEQRYIWILRRHPTAGWQIARYMRQDPSPGAPR